MSRVILNLDVLDLVLVRALLATEGAKPMDRIINSGPTSSDRFATSARSGPTKRREL